MTIFLEDHEPAHVHVVGDGRAKVALFGTDGEPQLVWVSGIKWSDMRRMMTLIRRERAMLADEWRRIHG